MFGVPQMTDCSDSPQSGSKAARSSLELVFDPVFGPFLAAKFLAASGIWIHNIVAAILAFELSGSTLIVGMVSVAQFTPQLLLAPLSGAMADRGNRRVQLVVGMLLVSLASGGLAGWIWIAGVAGLPSVWPLLVAALVSGLGFVLVVPALNAIIPDLVQVDELASAIELSSLPPTVARAGGPAIGALVATSLGAAPAFAISAVSNLMFALFMLRLRMRSRSDNRGGDRRIRAGIQYLRHDRGAVLLLVGVAAVGVGAEPVITLTPALSERFGGDAELVGSFASAFGVGAGVVFLILPALRRWLGLPHLSAVGLLTLSAGTASAGASSTVEFAVVSFAIAGSGMTVALTSLTTRLQERLPDCLRGRVMALWSMAFMGIRPAAAAASGATADAGTPLLAFIAVASAVAAAAWVCRPSELARHQPPS